MMGFIPSYNPLTRNAEMMGCIPSYNPHTQCTD